MGTQKSEAQLFSYAVNLAKRMRANHRLCQVKTAIVAYDLVTYLSRRSLVLRPIKLCATKAEGIWCRT
jgi:hypothetical protein